MVLFRIRITKTNAKPTIPVLENVDTQITSVNFIINLPVTVDITFEAYPSLISSQSGRYLLIKSSVIKAVVELRALETVLYE